MAQVADYYLPSLANVDGLTPWDLWDFDSTTDLSMVPDSTQDLQDLINQVEAVGWGGVIHLPPGVIRINGVVFNQGGLTVRGAGSADFLAPPRVISPDGTLSQAQRGRTGTYILTDASAPSTFTISAQASNVTIEDMAFIQTQPPEDLSFDPGLFSPCILLEGLGGDMFGATGCTLQRLLFWGVWQGILLDTGSGTDNVGRVLMRDIRGCSFDVMINLDAAADVAILQSITFEPSMLDGNPGQQAYIQNNGSAIYLGIAAQTIMSDLKIKNCAYGVWRDVSLVAYPGLRNKIIGADFVGVQAAIRAGLGGGFHLIGISAVGDDAPAFPPSVFLNLVGGWVDLCDCHVTGFQVIAISGIGGNLDLRMGANCWFDNWNTNPGVIGGYPNPAPAIYMDNGMSTATCTCFTNARWTNDNGGPHTGGSGTFVGTFT
jgi:hypothetical protein